MSEDRQRTYKSSLDVDKCCRRRMEYIIHNSRKRRAEILRGKRGFNVVNPKMMVEFKLEEEVEELDFQHGAHSEEQISMLRKATSTLSDFCKVTPVKQMKTAFPALF